MLVHMDPPEHRDYRAVAAPFLKTQRRRSLKTAVRAITIESLDRHAEVQDPSDFVFDLAASNMASRTRARSSARSYVASMLADMGSQRGRTVSPTTAPASEQLMSDFDSGRRSCAAVCGGAGGLGRSQNGWALSANCRVTRHPCR